MADECVLTLYTHLQIRHRLSTCLLVMLRTLFDYSRTSQRWILLIIPSVLFWLDNTTENILICSCIIAEWQKNKQKKQLETGEEKLSHRWAGGWQRGRELWVGSGGMANTVWSPQVQPSRWGGTCRLGLQDEGGRQYLSTSQMFV